ncbi:MAG: preprotein translocase subunit SecG [Defluviitaleaceae bacterium]|nr:preprotein translocase subunit SecG [Defluviitaleaceae bacterium]
MLFELGIIDYLLIIVSIVLIILVAMQNSKDDIGSALTGANSELFKHQKERGVEVYIVRITYGFSLAFVALSTLILLGIG